MSSMSSGTSNCCVGLKWNMERIAPLLNRLSEPELVEWAVVTVIVLLTTLSVLSIIMKEGLPQFFDRVMENLGFHRVAG